MGGQIIVGEGRELRTVSDDAFVNAIRNLPERMTQRLAFMAREHHTIRDFVVRELPRGSRPLTPSQIASVTGIELPRVVNILSELEQNLFFLVRNAEGSVNWAFPVTTDEAATASRSQAARRPMALEPRMPLPRPSCKDASGERSCGSISIRSAGTAPDPWRLKSTKS